MAKAGFAYHPDAPDEQAASLSPKAGSISGCPLGHTRVSVGYGWNLFQFFSSFSCVTTPSQNPFSPSSPDENDESQQPYAVDTLSIGSSSIFTVNQKRKGFWGSGF